MKTERVGNILLVLFSLIFAYGLAPFSVFDVGGQQLPPALLSGSLTEGVPINTWGFLACFLLAEIYMKLYLTAPAIPWYEIFHFFYVALSLFTILSILLKNNIQASKKAKTSFILLSLFLFTEFILVFQFTRVAFSLGIASTVILITNGKLDKKFITLSCFLFALCVLTRPEAGVLILFIQWLVVLLVSNRNRSKTALILNTTVLALVIGYITYDRLTSNSFLAQFEPELGYQLLDRGNITPLSTMTNAIDSAKYIAVINMITDQRYTTIPFLQSLVAEDAFTGINIELIQRAVHLLSVNLNYSFGLIVVYIGLLLIVIRQSLLSDMRTTVKILFFNLSIWLVIIITTYVIKMEVWVFSSIVVMLCFILISKIDYSVPSETLLSILLPVTIILAGVFIHFQQQQKYRMLLTVNLQPNEKFGNELKKRYPGKIILPSNDQKNMMLFNIRPFQMHDFSAFARVYLFDADVTYIEKHYSEYLKRECACDATDYTAFMDFLNSKKDSVRIISTPERIKVVKYYCHVVRGKDYNIVPVDSLNVNGNSVTVFTFQ